MRQLGHWSRSRGSVGDEGEGVLEYQLPIGQGLRPGFANQHLMVEALVDDITTLRDDTLQEIHETNA